MYASQPGPPRYKPTPMDGPELQLHPHRSHAICEDERGLVCLFLRRYAVWCACRRRIDTLRETLELLTDVARS